jgi:SAM-dependent methyltransferase
MTEPGGESTRAPDTFPLRLGACPLCGGDDPEPIAVGEDRSYRTTRDTLLVVSCTSCGVFYLNPRPVPSNRSSLYPSAYFRPADHPRSADRLVRSALRFGLKSLRSVPRRVLEVAYGARVHSDLLRRALPSECAVEILTQHEELARDGHAAGCVVRTGAAGALGDAPPYDLILLFHSLEHCEAPVEELTALGRHLQQGGRLLVLTPNAESAVCRRFQGRHWSGYDFPRHPCLYGPRALRRLAAHSGLEVERLGSLGDSAMWADSVENFLSDWKASSWVTGAARGATRAGAEVAALAGAGHGSGATGPQLLAVLRAVAGGPA